MGHHRSVAIVDDDQLIRWSAASLIRSLGVEATTFESAEAFLVADDQHFGCIISDIQMTGMSGLDLQDELNRRGDPTPFIFVTAYPTEPVRKRAMEGGACHFLSKPWSVEQVILCLEQIMGPLG